jgi:hypothetical protein
MQQFKRADPERLTHASKECALMAALEENVPKSPQEETVTENGMVSLFCLPNRDVTVLEEAHFCSRQAFCMVFCLHSLIRSSQRMKGPLLISPLAVMKGYFFLFFLF